MQQQQQQHSYAEGSRGIQTRLLGFTQNISNNDPSPSIYSILFAVTNNTFKDKREDELVSVLILAGLLEGTKIDARKHNMCKFHFS